MTACSDVGYAATPGAASAGAAVASGGGSWSLDALPRTGQQSPGLGPGPGSGPGSGPAHGLGASTDQVPRQYWSSPDPVILTDVAVAATTPAAAVSGCSSGSSGGGLHRSRSWWRLTGLAGRVCCGRGPLPRDHVPHTAHCVDGGLAGGDGTGSVAASAGRAAVPRPLHPHRLAAAAAEPSAQGSGCGGAASRAPHKPHQQQHQQLYQHSTSCAPSREQRPTSPSQSQLPSSRRRVSFINEVLAGGGGGGDSDGRSASPGGQPRLPTAAANTAPEAPVAAPEQVRLLAIAASGCRSGYGLVTRSGSGSGSRHSGAGCGLAAAAAVSGCRGAAEFADDDRCPSSPRGGRGAGGNQLSVEYRPAGGERTSSDCSLHAIRRRSSELAHGGEGCPAEQQPLLPFGREEEEARTGPQPQAASDADQEWPPQLRDGQQQRLPQTHSSQPQAGRPSGSAWPQQQPEGQGQQQRQPAQQQGGDEASRGGELSSYVAGSGAASGGSSACGGTRPQPQSRQDGAAVDVAAALFGDTGGGGRGGGAGAHKSGSRAWSVSALCAADAIAAGSARSLKSRLSCCSSAAVTLAGAVASAAAAADGDGDHAENGYRTRGSHEAMDAANRESQRERRHPAPLDPPAPTTAVGRPPRLQSGGGGDREGGGADCCCEPRRQCGATPGVLVSPQEEVEVGVAPVQATTSAAAEQFVLEAEPEAADVDTAADRAAAAGVAQRQQQQQQQQQQQLAAVGRLPSRTSAPPHSLTAGPDASPPLPQLVSRDSANPPQPPPPPRSCQHHRLRRPQPHASPSSCDHNAHSPPFATPIDPVTSDGYRHPCSSTATADSAHSDCRGSGGITRLTPRRADLRLDAMLLLPSSLPARGSHTAPGAPLPTCAGTAPLLPYAALSSTASPAGGAPSSAGGRAEAGHGLGGGTELAAGGDDGNRLELQGHFGPACVAAPQQCRRLHPRSAAQVRPLAACTHRGNAVGGPPAGLLPGGDAAPSLAPAAAAVAVDASTGYDSVGCLDGVGTPESAVSANVQLLRRDPGSGSGRSPSRGALLVMDGSACRDGGGGVGADVSVDGCGAGAARWDAAALSSAVATATAVATFADVEPAGSPQSKGPVCGVSDIWNAMVDVPGGGGGSGGGIGGGAGGGAKVLDITSDFDLWQRPQLQLQLPPPYRAAAGRTQPPTTSLQPLQAHARRQARQAPAAGGREAAGVEAAAGPRHWRRWVPQRVGCRRGAEAMAGRMPH